MNHILVFYMDALYAECSSNEYRQLRMSMPKHIYNNGWIYIHRSLRGKAIHFDAGWYRVDGTKKLRAYVLIHFD
jgi:hypothetical protein